MSSRVPAWHSSVGELGVPLFWLVMGVGAGAFGAVVFSIVNPNSESLRIFTTAVSAAMGAAGGAVATMIAHRRQDRAARLRKTKSAILRIDRLRLQYEAIVNLLDRNASITDDQIDAAKTDSELRAMRLLTVMLRDLQVYGGKMPQFDDLLETDEDVGTASHIEELFRASTLVNFFDTPGEHMPETQNAKDNFRLFRSEGMSTMLRDRLTTIATLKAHFDSKVRSNS